MCFSVHIAERNIWKVEIKMKKVVMMLVIATMVFCLTGCTDYMNEQTVQCVVKDKWIKRPSGNNDELYLINCGGTTYKISDLLWKGKFNSADIYGNLEIGKKYELSISGYRWSYFSKYQNINEYKEIVEKEGIENE